MSQATDQQLIFTVNSGSSSIKTALFSATLEQEIPTLLGRGKVEGIGVRPKVRISLADGKEISNIDFPLQQVPDQQAAFRLVTLMVQSGLRGELPVVVGHRIVHGGQEFTAPLAIDQGVLAKLHALEPMAPLHQPYNLAPIQAGLDDYPQVLQVACFDTAFHAQRNELSQLFGLPYELFQQGIRRYGFHGLSFEYISHQLARRFAKLAKGKLIIAHLGNGSSVCALDGGHSQEVSMSFSVLDGLPMGSRVGALDPGAVLHLLKLGEDAGSLEKLFYKESGLLGISGVSSDMRSLHESGEPRAELAIAFFAYRVAQEIGRQLITLGGLDALIFTAGIGEGDADLRRRVVNHLAPVLGLKLDEAANRSNAECISSADSARAILVIPTDEESMIAEHAWRIYREQSV